MTNGSHRNLKRVPGCKSNEINSFRAVVVFKNKNVDII